MFNLRVICVDDSNQLPQYFFNKRILKGKIYNAKLVTGMSLGRKDAWTGFEIEGVPGSYNKDHKCLNNFNTRRFLLVKNKGWFNKRDSKGRFTA